MPKDALESQQFVNLLRIVKPDSAMNSSRGILTNSACFVLIFDRIFGLFNVLNFSGRCEPTMDILSQLHSSAYLNLRIYIKIVSRNSTTLCLCR